MGKDLVKRTSQELTSTDPRGTLMGIAIDNLTGERRAHYRDDAGNDMMVALDPIQPNQGPAPTTDFVAGIMRRDGRLSVRFEGDDSPESRRAAGLLGQMASQMGGGNLPLSYENSPGRVLGAPQTSDRQIHMHMPVAEVSEDEYADDPAVIYTRRPYDPERRRRIIARSLFAAAAVTAFSLPYMAASDNHRAPFGITDIAHPSESPIVEDVSTIIAVPGKVISIFKIW